MFSMSSSPARMSPNRRTCQFPGCTMGEDGGAYKTMENLESQEMVLKDLEIHLSIRLAGVSAMTGNEAKVHKDAEERTSQACFKTEKVSTTKTSDSEELGDPHEKLKDSEWKVSHHVHDGTKWVRQQVDLHPIIGNLHVDEDRTGYRGLESPDPSWWAGPSWVEARGAQQVEPHPIAKWWRV